MSRGEAVDRWSVAQSNRETSCSKHSQFVGDPSCDCVFVVVGYDVFVGAENFKDAIILAFLKGEKAGCKSFSLGLGHTLASHPNVIEIGFRGIENADFVAVQHPATDQEVENGFIDSAGIDRSVCH